MNSFPRIARKALFVFRYWGIIGHFCPDCQRPFALAICDLHHHLGAILSACTPCFEPTDCYAHLASDHLAKAANRLDTLFGGRSVTVPRSLANLAILSK